MMAFLEENDCALVFRSKKSSKYIIALFASNLMHFKLFPGNSQMNST